MDQPVLVIEAGKTEKQYWKDIFRYRELFYFLAWRDILVRYKQTVIGVAWSVLRPLLTMLVFTVVFGRIAKLPSGGAPYPLLVFAGLLPWQFFSNSLTESSRSLISNTNLITKIYFPRFVIPASAVVVGFVDFLISFAILAGMMVWYGFVPHANILALPCFSLLAFAASMGAGLWLASLNVKYRDFKYIVPFIVQFGVYISPVGFNSSVVPKEYQLIYSLNPMVGVIDGFRWSLLGNGTFPWMSVGLGTVMISLLAVGGILYFRKTERTFADVI